MLLKCRWAENFLGIYMYKNMSVCGYSWFSGRQSISGMVALLLQQGEGEKRQPVCLSSQSEQV